ncbi:hypothetical protein OROGR_021491 [Orobanche gracilis]
MIANPEVADVFTRSAKGLRGELNPFIEVEFAGFIEVETPVLQPVVLKLGHSLLTITLLGKIFIVEEHIFITNSYICATYSCRDGSEDMDSQCLLLLYTMLGFAQVNGFEKYMRLGEFSEMKAFQLVIILNLQPLRLNFGVTCYFGKLTIDYQSGDFRGKTLEEGGDAQSCGRSNRHLTSKKLLCKHLTSLVIKQSKSSIKACPYVGHVLNEV